MGKDVISPQSYSIFQCCGIVISSKPLQKNRTSVELKAAIGKLEEWELLAIWWSKPQRARFYYGWWRRGWNWGCSPSFADHFLFHGFMASSDLYKVFKHRKITDRIVFIGSGKLDSAKAAMAFAMGADCINVAREAMMSIGCIQAQLCHTNRCPSGVATQSKWLQNGINIPLKSERLGQYFKTFRKELIEITHACGYEHPASSKCGDIDVNVDDHYLSKELDRTYMYEKGCGFLQRDAIAKGLSLPRRCYRSNKFIKVLRYVLEMGTLLPLVRTRYPSFSKLSTLLRFTICDLWHLKKCGASNFSNFPKL